MAMPRGQRWPCGSEAGPPPHHLLHWFSPSLAQIAALFGRVGTEEDLGMGFLLLEEC